VNIEHAPAFVDTVNGAGDGAIAILNVDTGIGNDISHPAAPRFQFENEYDKWKRCKKALIFDASIAAKATPTGLQARASLPCRRACSAAGQYRHFLPRPTERATKEKREGFLRRAGEDRISNASLAG
jgi:hypothetical protein